MTDDLLLEADHLTLRFGGVAALTDVSIHQARGEILSVIGPNGAGKTSLFNCLTGFFRPQVGSITFRSALGRELSIVGKSPHRVNRAGLARTFQTARLFTGLSTFENVKIGVESRSKAGPIGVILHLPRTSREERRADELSLRLLDFVGLGDRVDDDADSLSYGDRRRLEIARALGTQPEVLLLDEPAAGTNPTEKLALSDLIRRINTEMGISILLIEHDMRLVMSLAQRLYVLNFGKLIAEGTPAEIQRHPAVIEAYLGATEHDAAMPAATPPQ